MLRFQVGCAHKRILIISNFQKRKLFFTPLVCVVRTQKLRSMFTSSDKLEEAGPHGLKLWEVRIRLSLNFSS